MASATLMLLHELIRWWRPQLILLRKSREITNGAADKNWLQLLVRKLRDALPFLNGQEIVLHRSLSLLAPVISNELIRDVQPSGIHTHSKNYKLEKPFFSLYFVLLGPTFLKPLQLLRECWSKSQAWHDIYNGAAVTDNQLYARDKNVTSEK